VDGIYDAEEWSDARTYSFEYNCYPTPSEPKYEPNNTIVFYVKNDATTLYLAIKIDNKIRPAYEVYPLTLDIIWDVDKSGNETAADFKTYIDSNAFYTGVRRYIYNPSSEQYEWKCCYRMPQYNAARRRFAAGEGLENVVHEFAIALSNFGITPGGNISLKVDYEEHMTTTLIENISNEYITIQTAETEVDQYYYLARPILTAATLSCNINLSWNEIAGADHYLVYRSNVDYEQTQGSEAYGDVMEYGTFVANVTSTTANDSTNNWQWHNYDENFAQYYVVIAKNNHSSICSNSVELFWRYCEANGDTDPDDDADDVLGSIDGYSVIILFAVFVPAVSIMIRKYRLRIKT
jgi:hypothetical protein